MSSIVTVRLDRKDEKQLNLLKKKLNIVVGSKVLLHILNDYLIVKNNLDNVTGELKISQNNLLCLESAIKNKLNAEKELKRLLKIEVE